MSERDDARDPRAIILARRRIFLATALAAAVGTGCDREESPERPAERPDKPRRPKPSAATEDDDWPYGPNVCLKVEVVDPPKSATPSSSASGAPSASASQANEPAAPRPRVCLKRSSD